MRRFSMYTLHRFPPHLQYVAKLPYEIRKSKNFAEFTRWLYVTCHKNIALSI